MYQILSFFSMLILIGGIVGCIAVYALTPGPAIPSPSMIFTNEIIIEKK